MSREQDPKPCTCRLNIRYCPEPPSPAPVYPGLWLCPALDSTTICMPKRGSRLPQALVPSGSLQGLTWM